MSVTLSVNGGPLEREFQPKLELPRVEHGPWRTESCVRQRRDEQGFTWYRCGGNTPAGNRLLGWYSTRGGEIGDIPLDHAPTLDDVMKEVPLAQGKRTVPVQLMWSNAVAGPEGPISRPHPASTR